MANKKRKTHSIFAVHKWESSGRNHEVTTFYPSGVDRTKEFRKWSLAEKFAKEQAKKFNLNHYVIDTPKRPHQNVKV